MSDLWTPKQMRREADDMRRESQRGCAEEPVLGHKLNLLLRVAAQILDRKADEIDAE